MSTPTDSHIATPGSDVAWEAIQDAYDLQVHVAPDVIERRTDPGSVNIEIICAGTLVRLGDVVVGDQDGVVVKSEMVAEVAKLGAARIAKEQTSRARLQAGDLGVDFYGLRAKLRELGVEYVGE